MDGDENTGKVQQRGQHRLQRDLTVGKLDIVRHQEGGSTHDGGHDLPAGRGGGFRGSGKLWLVARLFHQRNGHGSGAHGICHGRAGDNALQGAGHHGNLGGAAGEPAHQSVGHLDEVVGNAGPLQEGPEDDKDHNELGAHVNGGGQNALLAIEQVADGVVQLAPEAGVGKSGSQGVHQEAPGHDQDGQAHASAADLRQRQNAHYTDDDLIGREDAALLDDGLGIGGVIQERTGAQHHHHDVIPGDMIGSLVGLPGREHQEPYENDPGHKGGQPQLLQPAGKQSHIQAKQRKSRQDHIDHDPGSPLPDPDVGLLVIFLHDGVQIHGLLGFVFLLEQAHNSLLLVSLFETLEKSSWGRAISSAFP